MYGFKNSKMQSPAVAGAVAVSARKKDSPATPTGSGTCLDLPVPSSIAIRGLLFFVYFRAARKEKPRGIAAVATADDDDHDDDDENKCLFGFCYRLLQIYETHLLYNFFFLSLLMLAFAFPPLSLLCQRDSE